MKTMSVRCGQSTAAFCGEIYNLKVEVAELKAPLSKLQGQPTVKRSKKKHELGYNSTRTTVQVPVPQFRVQQTVSNCPFSLYYIIHVKKKI